MQPTLVALIIAGGVVIYGAAFLLLLRHPRPLRHPLPRDAASLLEGAELVGLLAGGLRQVDGPDSTTLAGLLADLADHPGRWERGLDPGGLARQLETLSPEAQATAWHEGGADGLYRLWERSLFGAPKVGPLW